MPLFGSLKAAHFLQWQMRNGKWKMENLLFLSRFPAGDEASAQASLRRL
jgi:hypothetical protein